MTILAFNLEDRNSVLRHLAAAEAALSYAHEAASESEGDRTGLNGPVRDLIFGINSVVGTLREMIETAQVADG